MQRFAIRLGRTVSSGVAIFQPLQYPSISIYPARGLRTVRFLVTMTTTHNVGDFQSGTEEPLERRGRCLRASAYNL